MTLQDFYLWNFSSTDKRTTFNIYIHQLLVCDEKLGKRHVQYSIKIKWSNFWDSRFSEISVTMKRLLRVYLIAKYIYKDRSIFLFSLGNNKQESCVKSLRSSSHITTFTCDQLHFISRSIWKFLIVKGESSRRCFILMFWLLLTDSFTIVNILYFTGWGARYPIHASGWENSRS